MKNIYFAWWTDSILKIKKHHPDNWKLSIFFFNSWLNALNLAVIVLWLRYFKILDVPQLTINLIPDTLIDKFLSVFIEFALPFFILNYFLIFHKNKYHKLILKYDNIKINYAGTYSIIVLTSFITSIFLYGLLTGQL